MINEIENNNLRNLIFVKPPPVDNSMIQLHQHLFSASYVQSMLDIVAIHTKNNSLHTYFQKVVTMNLDSIIKYVKKKYHATLI